MALLFLAGACRALPAGFLAPAAGPTADPSPSPVVKTTCESGADLRVDVDFLRSLEIREDGLLSVLVAVDAALGEAQLLVNLVAEEYRPLVVDLVLALQGLRTTAEELADQETVGAGIASIGAAITEIGETMDALTLRLQEPCPQ